MHVCLHDGEQVFSDDGHKKWKLNNKSTPAVNGKRYQSSTLTRRVLSACVHVGEKDRYTERGGRE